MNYGPQTPEIVALIERARSLTARKARQLYAAWAAASDAARDAAQNAASDAARYAARDATQNAASDAAWNAAWDATIYVARDVARDAAWAAAYALVVRDLIGQHGFTHQHYDLLTGPWAQVIGPAHPDDVVPEEKP